MALMRPTIACGALVVWSLSVQAGPATVNIDERLHFTVAGAVECSGQCAAPVHVSLVGSRLGDTTPPSPEIAAKRMSPEERTFFLVGAVLLGYENQPSVPPAHRAVQLRVETEGCSPWTREFRLSEFKRDRHGYFLDLGRLSLACPAKSKKSDKQPG